MAEYPDGGINLAISPSVFVVLFLPSKSSPRSTMCLGLEQLNIYIRVILVFIPVTLLPHYRQLNG